MSNKGFVYLDFRKKLVYYGENYNISDCVPATIAEREAFIAHFYSKGIKECTFKQLKQYVNFHGTRKQGRIYATIHITDKHIYLKLMRKNEKNLLSAIDDFIIESYGKQQNDVIKNKAKFVAKHAIKSFLKTIENEMEKVFND